jgi:hypothetical protein
MPSPILDFSTLADFALGNLSPQQTLEVSQRLTSDPQAVRNLDFILKLLSHFENESNREEPVEGRSESKGSRRGRPNAGLGR